MFFLSPFKLFFHFKSDCKIVEEIGDKVIIPLSFFSFFFIYQCFFLAVFLFSFLPFL